MTLLTTQNLGIRRKQQLICHSLSLSINPGEIWAVLGGNGRGKSTLLHTLAGLYPAEQGKIYWQKSLLKHLSRRHIAQYIGILLQQQEYIFPYSVFDAIAQARYPHWQNRQHLSEEDRILIANIIQQFELTGLQQRKLHNLSGGEQQRVALATLFAQTPLLYLLDEPTNHLDLRYQHLLFTLLQKLTSHAAIVMALQDINLAYRYCTHALLLFADGTVMHGSKQQVLQEHSLSSLYQHTIKSLRTTADCYWVCE